MTQNVDRWALKAVFICTGCCCCCVQVFPNEDPSRRGWTNCTIPPPLSFRAHPFRLTCDAFEFHERELRRAVANDAKSLSCGVYVCAGSFVRAALFSFKIKTFYHLSARPQRRQKRFLCPAVGVELCKYVSPYGLVFGYRWNIFVRLVRRILIGMYGDRTLRL